MATTVLPPDAPFRRRRWPRRRNRPPADAHPYPRDCQITPRGNCCTSSVLFDIPTAWSTGHMLTRDLTFAGILSLVAAPLIALIASLLLRRRFPRSWPLTAMVLIPTLTAGAFLAATRNMADNFVQWLHPDSWQTPAALAVLALIVFTVIRRRAFTRAEATWAAFTLFVIGVASIPERHLGTLRHPGESVLACVTGGLDRYLPLNLDDIVDDMGPNVFLYAPLGFILAVRGFSLRRTVFTALALSGAVEIYQALLTSRVCAPRDVIANAAGALMGTGVVYVLTRRETQEPQVLSYAEVEP